MKHTSSFTKTSSVQYFWTHLCWLNIGMGQKLILSAHICYQKIWMCSPIQVAYNHLFCFIIFALATFALLRLAAYFIQGIYLFL